MAAFNPITDTTKAAEAFDNVFKASLMPAYKLGDFLTPTELAAAKAYKGSMADFTSNAGTDNQFFNLGAFANSQQTTDPVAKIQARLDSATAAELPGLLKQYGISQSSWDGYNTNRMALADQLSQNAADTSIQHMREYLLKNGVNITSMDQLNAMPASQKQQLVNGWLSTVKAERESGGFLSDAMGILGTVAGIATGNPWLGALAGGLSSGISTGSPLAGILGAAGGYFGAQGVADAGGFMNYINNTVSSIGNAVMHPIDTLTNALGNISSGFGGSGSSVASSVNDVAQAANSANDVLGGGTGGTGWAGLPGAAFGGNPVSQAASLGTSAGSAGLATGLGGISTAAGAGAGVTSAAQLANIVSNVTGGTGTTGAGSWTAANPDITGVTGSPVTGANGVLQSAGNTATTTGLSPVSTGLSGGDIAIGTGALGLGGAGAGVLQSAAGTTSGGVLGGATGSTLGSTVSGIMNSLFGTGGTGGLLGGSGISDSAMNLLSGIFGQMNSSDLSALQDKILKQNQMLTNYLPSTQWRDTLLNHLNTIVTNPGALVSSGPYKDYLDQATNSIERKAVAQGYGGVGQSSNTQNMVAQGLISNMNDIISKDYNTSVSALQPYFQVGTQGTTNLTNYSNSGLPSNVATSDLASILKIAQGAAPIASGLLKSIF